MSEKRPHRPGASLPAPLKRPKSLPVAEWPGGVSPASGRQYPQLLPGSMSSTTPKFGAFGLKSAGPKASTVGPPPTRMAVAQAVSTQVVSSLSIPPKGAKGKSLAQTVAKAVFSALPKGMSPAKIAETVRQVQAKPSTQPVLIPVGSLAAAVAMGSADMTESQLTQMVVGGPGLSTAPSTSTTPSVEVRLLVSENTSPQVTCGSSSSASRKEARAPRAGVLDAGGGGGESVLVMIRCDHVLGH